MPPRQKREPVAGEITATAARDEGWWAVTLSGDERVDKRYTVDPEDQSVIDLTVSVATRLVGPDVVINWEGSDDAGKRLARKAMKKTPPTE